MNFGFNSHYKIILHTQHECEGPTHSTMKLSEREASVLLQIVYPFTVEAPKELKVSYAPMSLFNINYAQEVQSIWAKTLKVIDEIAEQIPEGEDKRKFVHFKDTSRAYAAEKESEVRAPVLMFKVFGEVDREAVLAIAEGVILATRGIQQPVEIRFELVHLD